MKQSRTSLIQINLAVLWRRRLVSLLLLLLTAVGVFSTALLQNLAVRQARAMEEMTENTPIHCIVTDAQGASSDNLGMLSAFVDMLMGLRHERGCYVDEAVKNVRAKATYRLDEPNNTDLCRILNLASDSAFDTVSGTELTFLDGFSEADLLGTERVCIVPENMLMTAPTDADGHRQITIRLREDRVSLRVIGTVTGQTGATIWCPFYMILQEGRTDSFLVESCSFDIRDNHRLEQCKLTIYETFVRPALTNQTDALSYGVIVNDAEFIASRDEFESNLKTLHLLLPILTAIYAGVGFLAAYLTTRGRKREFAVMRCIGRKQFSIFRQVFAEQLLLAAIGAVLGAVLALAVEGGYPSAAVRSAGLLLGLFLLGAAVACFVVTNVNVMKLMKAED